MKYPEMRELYLDSGIYGDGDDEYRSLSKKIVRCRKPHVCMNCEGQIAIGDEALYEKAANEEGIASCYTCIPCIEKWLEESGQVEIEE